MNNPKRDRFATGRRQVDWHLSPAAWVFSVCVLQGASTAVFAASAEAPASIEAPPASTEKSPAPGARTEQTISDMLADTRPGNRYDNIESQIDAGELTAARRELLGDIKHIERDNHRYDAALIPPLRLLGRVYREQGEHASAAATLARATQISRVTGGLHNPEQIELVHEEIASLVALGQMEEANNRHEYAFQVAVRSYGSFGIEIVDDVLDLAEWYSDTGNVFGARRHYAHARNLMSAHQPANVSEPLLRSLRGLARSYRDERFPPYYSRSDAAATAQFKNSSAQREQITRSVTDTVMTVNDFHRGTEALIQIVRLHELRLVAQQRRLLARETQHGDATDSEAIDGDAINSTAETTDGTGAALQAIAAAGASGAAHDTEANPAEAARAESRRARKRAKRRETLVGPSTDISAISYAIAHADIDKTAFIDSIVALADWYLLMNKSPRAFALYQHAYRIAEADPNSDAAALFAEPSLLYYPEPNNPKVPDSASESMRHQGFVELSYQVDHRGNVRRLTTINTHPEGMMEFQVRRSMGISRYRPRLVDGLPQPTPDVSYRHNFSYFQRTDNSSAGNELAAQDTR